MTSSVARACLTIGTMTGTERKPVILRVWRAHGRYCVVADNGIGFYVGYVMILEDHPWHGREYEEIPAEGHMGITFSGERDWIGWDGDGAPPGWYVGWDGGHYCCRPIPDSYMSDHWPKGEWWHPTNVEWAVSVTMQLAMEAEVAEVAAKV